MITANKPDLSEKDLARTLLRRGYLSPNEDYQDIANHVPEAEVESSPTRYIMSECVMACKELWKKGVYTYMTSDYSDQGQSFIEIAKSSLSDENLEVLKDMYLSGEALVFQNHEDTISFGVNEVGLAAMINLLTLAQKFRYQDVPYGEGYVSPEEFLIRYCHCSKEVANPEYYQMKNPWDFDDDMQDLEEYINKFEEWSNSIHSVPTIVVLDETKVTRSVADYAQMHGMIYDGERVYLSAFHYQKHLKYLEEKRTEEILSCIKH